MTQVLELFPPFWSKKFCAWYFSRFQPKKWTQEEELWRKGCVCFKGPKWKEISSEIRLSCDSRGLPVRTQSRGCFIVAGLSTESVTPMSVRTERDSLPTCRNVSSSQFWGGIEKSPCSSLEAQHRIAGMLERPVRGRTAPEVLDCNYLLQWPSSLQ